VTDPGWTMALECTGRGRHDSATVYEQTFRGAREDLTPEALWMAPTVSSLEVECSVCGRAPRLRAAHLFKLALATVERMTGDVRRVAWDVSRLDR